MVLEDALRQILVDNRLKTQDEIGVALAQSGFAQISQSKISRLLRKFGAIKAKNAQGKVVYRLPKEPSPPPLSNPIDTLAIEVVANEMVVMVHTSPGAAQLLGRILDHHRETFHLLGTIAGDDCVLVIPQSIQNTTLLKEQLKEFLYL